MNAITDPRPDFHEGEYGNAGGVEYRIEAGRKAPGDLILKIRAPEWVAVGMDLGGLLADFHSQVEDLLYPPALGKKGAGKFFEHLQRARRHGWRFAAAVLSSEKTLRRFQIPAAPSQLPFDWDAEGIFDGGRS